MQVSILKCNGRVLSRGAAMLIVGSLAAGCSSGVSRFGAGVDDIFTSSTATPNQREIIRPQAQTYPGNEVASAAPVDSTYTGSVSSGGAVGQPVSRSALPPVSSSSSGSLAPVASAPASSAPVRVASAPVESPRSGSLSAPAREPAMATGETDPAGWSRAGGTQVTIKDGETLYNLSRRFGVPVNVIAKVNGLSESAGLQTGQKVVIPTYVYSKNAPVSAPDNNPKVAAAKSSTGNKEPSTEKVAAAKPAAGAGGYTVQEGDTLSKIAKTLGVSTVALRQANALDDGPIRVGQTLTVPAGGKATVAAAPAAKADPVVTSSAPAKQPAKTEQVATYTPPKKSAEKTMEQAEQDQAAAPDATGIGKMRWPVRGRVVSGYGKGAGKASDGIDIAVPEGTPVKAAENGIVIYAGDGLKEFGNTVLVRHENGLVTVYGNASELKVSRGDKVKRGQDIALSGMTGAATAPKLHFEVRKNSAPVDPSTFLE